MMHLEKNATKHFQLDFLFEEINQRFFDSLLPQPQLRWNTRLRSAAGRFIPGRKVKIYFLRDKIERPPVIEIAQYLKEHQNSEHHIKDTLAHEMIHYWLWYQKKPYGHTVEFKKKMIEMGVSRYNSVPMLKKHKYIYACPQCEKEFYAKKKWKACGCLQCCKKYNNGIFHVQFKLYLKEVIGDE